MYRDYHLQNDAKYTRNMPKFKQYNQQQQKFDKKKTYTRKKITK